MHHRRYLSPEACLIVPIDLVRRLAATTFVLVTDVDISSFAILLPPVGVFLERGCNADFLINILLVSFHLLCMFAPAYRLYFAVQTILGYMYATSPDFQLRSELTCPSLALVSSTPSTSFSSISQGCFDAPRINDFS